jgi:hypothetical protein
MTNNTNFWDVCCVFFYLLFVFGSGAGVCYLIDRCGWSEWTLLFWLFVLSCIQLRTGYGP